MSGVVRATAVGLLAYFGGKALAHTVGRYGLYAAVVIAVAFLIVVAVPRLTRRLRSRGPMTTLPHDEM